MTRRTTRLVLLLAALVLLGESRAWADFTYSWTVQPATVIPGGTGSVILTPASGTGSYVLGSSSPTVMDGATVMTTSSATVPPDSFNTDFSMKLKLTEGANTGELTFAGTIAGQLTQTTSTLTSTFHTPTTQDVTLGNHVFTVTIDPLPFASLPAPGGQAKIDALVTVAGAGQMSTPEPSSLLLGATAALGFAARRWLRKRGRPA
jgi:hypothetical protein